MAYKLMFLSCDKETYHWVYKQYPFGQLYIEGEIGFSPAIHGNKNTYLIGFSIPYMCPEPSKKWLFSRIKEIMYMKDTVL